MKRILSILLTAALLLGLAPAALAEETVGGPEEVFEGLLYEYKDGADVYTLTGNITLDTDNADKMPYPQSNTRVWNLSAYTLTLPKGTVLTVKGDMTLHLSGSGRVAAESGEPAIKLLDGGHIVANDGGEPKTYYTGGEVNVWHKDQFMGGVEVVTGCESEEIAKKFIPMNLSSDVDTEQGEGGLCCSQVSEEYSVSTVPVEGRPSAQFGDSGWVSVYANGCPIKVVAGTTEGCTNILWDADEDNTIEDSEYLQIGDTSPSAVGYEIDYLFGASANRAINGDTSVEMTGGELAWIYGGGPEGAAVSGSVNIMVTGGYVDQVVGGSGSVTGEAQISVGGNAEVNALFGGGDDQDPFTGGTVQITVADNAKVYNLYSAGYGASVANSHITVTGGEVSDLHAGGREAITGTMPHTGRADVTITGGTVENLTAEYTDETSLTVGGGARVGLEIKAGEAYYYVEGIKIGGDSGFTSFTVTPALTKDAMVCVKMDTACAEAAPYPLIPSCADPDAALVFLHLYGLGGGSWTAEADGKGGVQAVYAPPGAPEVDMDRKTVTAPAGYDLLLETSEETGNTVIFYGMGGTPSIPLQIGADTDAGAGYDLSEWSIVAEEEIQVEGGAVKDLTASWISMTGGAAARLTADQISMKGGTVEEVHTQSLQLSGSGRIGGNGGRGLVWVPALAEQGALRVVDGVQGPPFTGFLTLWLPADFSLVEPVAFFVSLKSEKPDKEELLGRITLSSPGAHLAQLLYQSKEIGNSYAAAISLDYVPPSPTPTPDPTPWPEPSGGSDDDHDSAEHSKPVVTVSEGGAVKADGRGKVTVTPEEGWRVAKITINGVEVAVPADGVLTGIKGRDKVEVIFEEVPATPKPAAALDQFTDLEPEVWYSAAIDYVLAQGLFRGTSETSFSPDAPMSRAMFFTVLSRMSGEQAEGEGGGLWYKPALEWAVESGISDGSDPDGEITREQLVTMLYRYSKMLPGNPPEGSGTAASFTDMDDVSGYAEEAVRWAIDQGILAGKGDGMLDPQGKATRAETAAMLMRFLTNIEK